MPKILTKLKLNPLNYNLLTIATTNPISSNPNSNHYYWHQQYYTKSRVVGWTTNKNQINTSYVTIDRSLKRQRNNQTYLRIYFQRGKWLSDVRITRIELSIVSNFLFVVFVQWLCFCVCLEKKVCVFTFVVDFTIRGKIGKLYLTYLKQ